MTLALKFWREIALALAAVLIIGLGSALSKANTKITDLRASRDEWRVKSEALTKQIKTQAKDEGKRYENTEAGWLARCRDSYRAGARSLPNDADQIRSGRYLPKSGTSPPKR
jgi:hypothetical protein